MLIANMNKYSEVANIKTDFYTSFRSGKYLTVNRMYELRKLKWSRKFYETYDLK